MADIRAFRGFRYDLGRAGALSDLVAPPYDVIDANLQQELYDRSPHNAIRLELTKDEPGDTPTRNRYTRAGQALSGWQTDHVLQQDTLRTLYQPFRSAPSSPRQHFSHSGLGLAICRKLVGAMGSELAMKTRPGWGTRFSFELELPPSSKVA